jgi:hypothetical protein
MPLRDNLNRAYARFRKSTLPLRFRFRYYRRALWNGFSIEKINAVGTILIVLATIAVFISTTLQWLELSRSDERASRAWLSPLNIDVQQV